jgi:hypothetical protein
MRIAFLVLVALFLAPAIADVSTDKAAVAEAMALMEPAKIALETAYKTHRNAFPKVSEFQVSVPSSAQYVKSVSYLMGADPGQVSLVARFGSLSYPNIDGILVGFFGKGGENGEVSWKCDAVASDVAVYPEEPPMCVSTCLKSADNNAAPRPFARYGSIAGLRPFRKLTSATSQNTLFRSWPSRFFGRRIT